MRMDARRHEKSPARMPFEAQDKPARRTRGVHLNARPHFKSMPHLWKARMSCMKHDDGLHKDDGAYKDTDHTQIGRWRRGHSIPRANRILL